jgi:hypothetical protein
VDPDTNRPAHYLPDANADGSAHPTPPPVFSYSVAVLHKVHKPEWVGRPNILSDFNKAFFIQNQIQELAIVNAKMMLTMRAGSSVIYQMLSQNHLVTPIALQVKIFGHPAPHDGADT